MHSVSNKKKREYTMSKKTFDPDAIFGIRIHQKGVHSYSELGTLDAQVVLDDFGPYCLQIGRDHSWRGVVLVVKESTNNGPKQFERVVLSKRQVQCLKSQSCFNQKV